MLGCLGHGDFHVWKTKTLGGSRAAHKKSRQTDGSDKRKPCPSHRANAVLKGLSANAANAIVLPLELKSEAVLIFSPLLKKSKL